jgi:hypothetical protein
MFCLHEIKGTKVFREAKLLLRLLIPPKGTKVFREAKLLLRLLIPPLLLLRLYESSFKGNIRVKLNCILTIGNK